MDLCDEFIHATRDDKWGTLPTPLLQELLMAFQRFNAERKSAHILDVIAAARRQGYWLGGAIPFGYRHEGRLLIPDTKPARLVRLVFELFDRYGSIRLVLKILVGQEPGTRWTST